MKELLPALWLPMSNTLIFFRGANNVNPRFSAIRTKPGKKKQLVRFIHRLGLIEQHLL